MKNRAGMRKFAALIAVLMLAVFLAACATQVPRPSRSDGTTTSQPEPAKVNPYAAIPTDGEHERAAVEAVVEALKYVEKTTQEQGREVTDLSQGTPTLVSYTLQAKAGKRTCLFEVRGDGKAYELYRYPATPDPAKLFWQDSTLSKGARMAEPLGTGETAAAAAVGKVVEDAATGEDVTVSIYGYNFYWIKDDGTPVSTPGGAPCTLSIDPEGAAGSWSM